MPHVRSTGLVRVSRVYRGTQGLGFDMECWLQEVVGRFQACFNPVKTPSTLNPKA